MSPACFDEPPLSSETAMLMTNPLGPKRLLSRLAISLFALSAICLSADRAESHGKGMFATQSEAEARARELNCKGSHENNGKWMPCQDEADLHRALRRQ